jgi:hypothetical protein
MSRKKHQPKRVRFFLADEIRTDDQSKPLIIGLFVDDQVLVNNPLEPKPEKPIALQSITVLVSLIDCAGRFDAETSLYGPDGAVIFEGRKIEGGVTAHDGESVGLKNMNLILKFSPFMIPSYGDYRLDLKLDKKTYKYEFRILNRSSVYSS